MSVTAAHSITAAVNPPRAAFLDYPLGNTAGPPDDPATQDAILGDVLDAFESIDTPGTIVSLNHVWHEEWKDGARDLRDVRAPRHDTPQYQTEQDRLNAVDRHGETTACAVCAPSAVPFS